MELRELAPQGDTTAAAAEAAIDSSCATIAEKNWSWDGLIAEITDEDNAEDQVPYPEFATTTFRSLRQRTWPRSWCLKTVMWRYPLFLLDTHAFS